MKREPEEDWGWSVIYPTLFVQLLHRNVECRDEIVRVPPHKSVCFIITGRKHANKIWASVAERRNCAPAYNG